MWEVPFICFKQKQSNLNVENSISKFQIAIKFEPNIYFRISFHSSLTTSIIYLQIKFEANLFGSFVGKSTESDLTLQKCVKTALFERLYLPEFSTYSFHFSLILKLWKFPTKWCNYIFNLFSFKPEKKYWICGKVIYRIIHSDGCTLHFITFCVACFPNLAGSTTVLRDMWLGTMKSPLRPKFYFWVFESFL